MPQDSSPPTSQAAGKLKRKNFDWISNPRPDTVTPFQQFILDIDWKKSPLGPIELWPHQLRQMVLIVVADPTPAVVYWGDEATMIYNEAYTELIGLKHPTLQGQNPNVEFPEVWDYLQKLLDTQRETGLATVEGNQLLLLRRHGFLEETYFSWKHVPVIGDDGYVVGSHATVLEVTREVISDRRLSTVHALSQDIATTKTIKDLWSQILCGLEHADKDIPLALIYSIGDATESSSVPNGFSGSVLCTLEGSIGIPEGHRIAPSVFELLQNKNWLAESFRKAMRAVNPTMLQVKDGTLPSGILEGIAWRGFGVPSSAMVVCPIHSTHSDDAIAILVLALNPRRPYDEDYENFVGMLTKQITTPQVSAVLLREEVWKRQMVAKQEALDRAKLSQELTTLALEFEQIETKFAKFAARAQVGLVIADAAGVIMYANNLWHELTQLEIGCGKTDWAGGIVTQDLDFVYMMYDRIIHDGNPASFQFRLKKQWKNPTPDKNGNHTFTDTHVLCSSYPDLDDNGKVTSVMSVLTNISELKFIEAQLRRRTADVEQREQMWRNFTDRAPIGLCLINADGSLEFGNDSWWSMTETPRDEKSGLSWLQKSVLREDVPNVEQMFQNALVCNTAATFEFRLNRFWDGPQRHNEQGEVVRVRTTILGTFHTTFNDDGTVRHIVGWLTDISAQKAAEGVLRVRMDQAIEMKQQQEKFIDMTSHEMRNPLSAMLHCADAITTSLTDYRNVTPIKKNGPKREISASHKENVEQLPQTLIDDAIEAADTIIYCAMHQKRIVDDILTLSRLDSELLLISPEAEQPVQLVRNATKMFEAELKQAQMTLEFHEEQSIRTLNVQWTLLDPSRVLQIFINIMTNAIKFTRTEDTRHIKITIGASLTKPSDKSCIVEYIPISKNRRDHTNGPEWGDGEIIYLSISVTDTGRGLSEQERKVLFHLFQQASPKTHVRYGGSGLGLFISRQLVEMQGGQIGVASEAGKGSTFSFFIKTRQTTPPVTAPTDSEFTLSCQDSLDEACNSRVPAQSKIQNGINGQSAKRQKLNTDPASRASDASTDLHILVVEDNLVNQKVVSKQLRTSGCTVSVANHGAEALEILSQSEYWSKFPRGSGKKLSVVLMDLEMPVMDGITCVRRIREWQTLGKFKGHIPVIAVTANARKDQILEAMNAGMDDVTTKPYRILEMLKKVEKLVAKYGSPSDSIPIAGIAMGKEIESNGNGTAMEVEVEI